MLADRVDMMHDKAWHKPPARFCQLIRITRACTDSSDNSPPLARVVELRPVFIPPFPVLRLMTLRLARASLALLHQSPA